MPAIHHLAALLLTHLLWASLQAVVLVGIVALLIRLLPGLPAALRTVLWWLVAFQVVLGLCWHVSIRLPLPAPSSVAAQLVPLRSATKDVLLVRPASASAHVPTTTASSGKLNPITAGSGFFSHWRTWLVAAWLFVLCVQLLAISLQLRRMYVLRRRARPPADDSLQVLCAEQAHRFNLKRCPPVRITSEISSPLVLGLLRPIILWPAEHKLTFQESSLVLAHELAHLQRGDLWLGCIPALAQRLFFFHPLIRWAVREYALYREAACDAQVLQKGTHPHDYGCLLLRLGVAPVAHSSLGGASSTFRNLKRRLSLLQPSAARARSYGWLLAALVLIGALPYQIVFAASSAPRVGNGGLASTAVGLPGISTQPSVRAPDVGFKAHHVHIDTRSNAPYGFVLFEHDTVIANGTDADLARARQLHKANEPMVWFRRRNVVYVTRDQGTIERAKRIYAPLIELAQQRGELAGEQGAVSGRLAGLASRETALREVGAPSTGSGHPYVQQKAALRTDLDAQIHAQKERQHALAQQQVSLQQRQRAVSQEVEQSLTSLIEKASQKGLARAINQ